MQDTDDRRGRRWSSGTPRALSEDAYPDDQIHEGEITKEDPVTGKEWLVTKWAEKPDGRIIALEKEEW